MDAPITKPCPTTDLNASILEGFTMDDIQEMIRENPSLRGYLQGYLAERVLKSKLLCIEGVSEVVKIQDRNPEKGDFKIMYKNTPITLEVKSVMTASVREDILTQDWQGSVLTKNTDKRQIEIEGLGTLATTKLHRGQFDILAICCFAVSGKWDFLFLENRFIPSAKESQKLLVTKFTISPYMTPGLTSDLVKLLEKTLQFKAKSAIPEPLTG